MNAKITRTVWINGWLWASISENFSVDIPTNIAFVPKRPNYATFSKIIQNRKFIPRTRGCSTRWTKAAYLQPASTNHQNPDKIYKGNWKKQHLTYGWWPIELWGWRPQVLVCGPCSGGGRQRRVPRLGGRTSWAFGEPLALQERAVFGHSPRYLWC